MSDVYAAKLDSHTSRKKRTEVESLMSTIPSNDEPIVVAPTPTPFKDDEQQSVDFGALERNVGRWLETPLSGFVVVTANGEETTLSESERLETVKTVVSAHNGEKFVIAGVDERSTTETLRLSENYANAGADFIRMRIPRNMSPSDLVNYYGYVTSRCPVPVVVIHQTFAWGGNPAAPPPIIAELCSMDNVFAYITDHSIIFEQQAIPRIPSNVRKWICSGALLAFGTMIGCDGACMLLGNIAPALCMDTISAGFRGDYKTAVELQRTASKLNAIVMNTIGAPKTALAMLGYEYGDPRRPTAPVSDESKAAIDSILRETGLL